MAEWVIDTNVPIVANGATLTPGARSPTAACRESAVRFLLHVVTKDVVLIDHAGSILAEYRRYLSPRGQPGVGDRFYQTVLQSSPLRVRRVDLPRRDDGEFASLPEPLIAADFDPSDRKFAALAHQETAPVANATDSDWIIHSATLAATGVDVRNICGCDRAIWFTD